MEAYLFELGLTYYVFDPVLGDLRNVAELRADHLG